MEIIESTFWVLFGIIFYIYFGYLLFLVFLSLFYRKSTQNKETYEPTVSIIIAAYNEESIIEQKIENTLMLDYPKDKIEIIVFSDASTDKTDEIIKRNAYRGIKLIRIEGRMGKTYCKNEALKMAKGEIIVFSDANSIYELQNIHVLVKHFKNPSVGCVSGELRYINGKSTVIAESIYWRYEQIVKHLESLISSLTSANGAIYAVRKALYEPLPSTAIDDLAASLMIRQKGYKVLYESKAVAWEATAKTISAEFHRRVRMVTRATYTLLWIPTFRSLLNPFKNFILACQIWSHKILRWLSGLFLIFLFICNIILVGKNWIYDFLMIVQIFFYLLAILGYMIPVVLGKKDIKLTHTAYYFCLSCIAMLTGFYNGLKKRTFIIWTPNRQ